MKKTTLLISFLLLSTGFVSSCFIFKDTKAKTYKDAGAAIPTRKSSTTNNPFVVETVGIVKNTTRIENLELELSLIKQQLHRIDSALLNAAETAQTMSSTPSSSYLSKRSQTSALTQPIYNLASLIRGGVDPTFAEDIVRRRNGVELKRMELQDIATRGEYFNTPKYYEELDAINSQVISLRDELGVDKYDDYLFNSRQNNRISILSIMLGSVAEQAGIQNGDIVLSYDNTRILKASELKEATLQGQLGEYVIISIYRNGEVFSFSVPRGPLGMKLRAIRLAP
jgi:C-terminal processing protease CtpA/Prc